MAGGEEFQLEWRSSKLFNARKDDEMILDTRVKRKFERFTNNSSSHSSEQVIYRVGISLEVVCCCSNLPKEKKNRDFKLMLRALSQIGIYLVGTLPQVCSFRSEAY